MSNILNCIPAALRLPAPYTRTTTSLPPLPDEVSEVKTEIPRAHAAAETESRLPEIEDLTTFLVKPIEKPKVLIEGLLRQGNELILGAGSKSYKTFALLDLGLSIACGVPWLGMNTTQGKVLFVNFELKDYSINDRLRSIIEARSLDVKPGQFELWNLRGKSESFTILIPKILARIKNNGYACVILDPVYKLYGSLDENSAGDVANLMNQLERVTVEAGAAPAGQPAGELRALTVRRGWATQIKACPTVAEERPPITLENPRTAPPARTT